MSIVALKRLTVYGLASEKERILAGVQQLGCLHVIDLRPPGDRPPEPASDGLRDGYAALRHLVSSPQPRRPRSERAITIANLVDRAIANHQQLRATRDELDDLRQSIRELEPWGDFTVPPPEALSKLRLWFYVVPLRDMAQVRAGDHVWQLIRQDHRHAYVVVIAETAPAPAPAPEAMPGQRVDLGSRSLSALRRDEAATAAREQDLITERWSLTRGIEQLRHELTRAENRAALQLAALHTHDSGEVFAIRGWVPADRLRDIHRFADREELACTCEDPAPGETPPVLLQNRPPVAAGEDLISFFQLPGYRDWDPSAVVFVSFALFFAIIMSDAGYAACLGLGLLLVWRRLGRSANGRRWRRLAAAIVTVAAGYGVLVGSYFGVTPNPGSTAARLKLLDLNDFNGMMLMTIGIGAVHLMAANGVVAWRRRHALVALGSVGWVLVIAGGMALLLARSSPGLGAAGPWLVGAGTVAVLLFSSERRLQSPRDLLWRLLDGLKAATGLTSAVGDVLSYLRLFALGLASASLAITFNGLAVQAIDSAPGIGLLFGILILLLGHALNLVLVIIGGVVHGLRLNLIEFYRWGIHDEGRPFHAFRNKETIPWTN
jgi:V/A-type H+-transporting ATPase subunit I